MSSLTKDQMIEAISDMSVLELSELVSALEEKFGVSAAAPVAAAAPAAAAVDVEEQSEFDVVLLAAGDKKIQVIKAVRAATGLGLKDAKDLVDSSPKPVKTGLDKAAAEELLKQLTDAGAQAEMK